MPLPGFLYRRWKKPSPSNNCAGWKTDIASRSLKRTGKVCALKPQTMCIGLLNTSGVFDDGTLHTDLRHEPKGCDFTLHDFPLPGDTGGEGGSGRLHGVAATTVRFCLRRYI